MGANTDWREKIMYREIVETFKGDEQSRIKINFQEDKGIYVDDKRLDHIIKVEITYDKTVITRYEEV